jgi:hypothetical protein
MNTLEAAASRFSQDAKPMSLDESTDPLQED